MNKHFIFGLGLGYLFTRGGARRNLGGATGYTGDVPWPIVKQGIIEKINKGRNGKEYLESLKGETIELPAGEYTFYKNKSEKINRRKIESLDSKLYILKGKESKKNRKAYFRIGSILPKIVNEESAIPWKEVKQGIIDKGEEYLQSTFEDGGVKGRVIKLPTSGEYKFYPKVWVGKSGEKRKAFAGKEEINTWKMESIRTELYILKGKEGEGNGKKPIKIGTVLFRAAKDLPLIKVGYGKDYWQQTLPDEQELLAEAFVALNSSGLTKEKIANIENTPSKKTLRDWANLHVPSNWEPTDEDVIEIYEKLENYGWSKGVRDELKDAYHEILGGQPREVVYDQFYWKRATKKEKELLGEAFVALGSEDLTQTENTPLYNTLWSYARDYAANWKPMDLHENGKKNIIVLYEELANYGWSKGVRKKLLKAYPEIEGGQPREAVQDKLYWRNDLPDEKELLVRAFVALNNEELNERKLSQNKFLSIENTPSRDAFSKHKKIHALNWEPTDSNVTDLYNELANYGWSGGVREALRNAYPWLPQENPHPRRWGSPQQNPRPRRWGSRW